MSTRARDETARPHPPTPEQTAAIEARERDVLLEAGAGTGKTRVLVERYVEAALELGSLDPILAFTFTERAAGELRSRVLGELAERAERAEAAGEEELAALARELVASADEAWISTIHGFCRRLLAAHPLALGLDPGFRVLDALESRRLADRAFDSALEAALDEDADGELARFVAATRVGELATMVRRVYEGMRAQGRDPVLPRPPAPDVGAASAELVVAAREALEETAAAGESKIALASRERLGVAAALADGPEPSQAAFDALELRTKAKAFCGPACERYRQAFSALRSARAEAAALGTIERLGRLLELYSGSLAELKAARSGLDFEDLQLRACELLERSPGIAEQHRARLRHIMVDEFQDTNALQIRLIDLLRGPDTVLFRVGDEFQSIYGFRNADVDAFRAERAAARERPGDAVLGLRGNFRSSDAILAAVDRLGSATLDGFVPLAAGRDAGATTAPGPPPDDEPELGVDDTAGGQLSLLAGPGDTAAPTAGAEREPDAPDHVELLLTPETSEWDAGELGLPGDYPSSPVRVAEARFLAARLAELVAAGETEPGRIVVLLRAYTNVSAYEDALEATGLRPYVVGGRGFWSAQQVDDVRRLLSVIANPLDDESLLGVLASPACGVRPETLWLLAAARRDSGRAHLWSVIGDLAAEPGEPGDPDGDAAEPADDEDGASAARRLGSIEAGERAALLELRERIVRLRRLAGLVGLEELIDRACAETGYDLVVLAMADGPRRWANVRKLMRLAREFEETEGRDLRGLLEALERGAEAAREGEAATEAEDHDGVRVMTVHAAKGLEFDTVAVAELGRSLGPPGRPPGAVVERIHDAAASPRVGLRLARFGARAIGAFGFDELTDQAAEADSEEGRRLAYVAATRAERRLLLSGSFSESRMGRDESSGVSASTPVSERLMRSLGLGPEPGAERLEIEPAPAREGLERRPAPGAFEIRVNRPGDPATAPRPRAGSEAAELRPAPPAPRIERRGAGAVPRLSPSSLAGFERCGYRFYAERIVGLAPREPGGATGSGAGSGGARGFGNAVHALLERSALEGWAAPRPADVEAALDSEAVERRHTGRAIEMIEGWLGSELRASLDGRRVRPEVGFVLPAGGALIRGTIDLLADGEVPLVVDYKTDRVGDSPLDAIVDRYGVQRDLYALAVRAALGAERVATAYVFLERAGEPVVVELDAAALDAAALRVGRSVERIARGEFEVTGDPHRALCFDCPARSTLCSHEQIPELPRELSEAGA